MKNKSRYPGERFKIGDRVIFKYKKDLDTKRYYYGGNCQGGVIGRIIAIRCDRLEISLNDKRSKKTKCYTMLECEIDPINILDSFFI